MDITKLLDIMNSHNGICVMETTKQSRSYRDILELVSVNQRALHTLGCIQTERGQHVIFLDVSLGWRAISIMLAALAEKVAVVFVDSHKNPMQTKQIRKQIQPNLMLESEHVDNNGRIRCAALSNVTTPPNHALKDIAFIMYTSGTTGSPKGVLLTFANIWCNVSDIHEYFHIQDSDRILIIRPFTNASAVTGELFQALYSGASIIIKDNEASPLQALKMLEEHQISLFCTTPTIASQFARYANRYDFSGIRTLVLSGESVKRAHAQTIHDSFNSSAIWNAYGLTEASPRVSCMTSDRDQFLSEYSCVGRPLRQTKVKITDSSGTPVNQGEEGILYVTGPNIMAGYYNDPEATRMKIVDGWLCTSDRAYVRDGKVYIVGRNDSLIIRAGVNIDPMEVEAVLLELEGVYEAFVFGQKEYDRVSVHAWVVAASNLDEKAIAKQIWRSVPDTRLWPDIITIKTSLPRTSSGKILRKG